MESFQTHFTSFVSPTKDISADSEIDTRPNSKYANKVFK